MRYFIIFILAIVCLITLNFFIEPSKDTSTELIISPYVFDESITDPNEFDENTIFSFEPLELNKVRLMAPTAGAGIWNLNILFEYEGGTIEVFTDDVQISVDADAQPLYYTEEGFKSRRFGYNMLLNESGYLSFYPIGGCYGYHDLDEKVTYAQQHDYTETGHEYYITVNAYKNSDDKWPIITAKLKLVKLEDLSFFSESSKKLEL